MSPYDASSWSSAITYCDMGYMVSKYGDPSWEFDGCSFWWGHNTWWNSRDCSIHSFSHFGDHKIVSSGRTPFTDVVQEAYDMWRMNREANRILLGDEDVG